MCGGGGSGGKGLVQNSPRYVSTFIDRGSRQQIIIMNFIYNAPVPVLQKRAPSTVQLHISGSIHS